LVLTPLFAGFLGVRTCPVVVCCGYLVIGRNFVRQCSAVVETTNATRNTIGIAKAAIETDNTKRRTMNRS